MRESATQRDLSRARPLAVYARRAPRTPVGGRALISRIGLGLAGYDAVAVVVALAVMAPGHLPARGGRVALTTGIALLGWFILLRLFALHRSWDLPAAEELRRIVGAGALGTLTLTFANGSSGASALPSPALLFAILVALEVVGRAAVRGILGWFGRHGRLALRTIVVGAQEEAVRLAEHLASLGGRFAPVGLIQVSATHGSQDGYPVIGTLEDVEIALAETRVDCLFVADAAVSNDDVDAISRACRRANVELRVTTKVAGVRPSRLLVESADGVTSLVVRPIRLTGEQAALKRCFDLLIGCAAFLVALPLLGVIALAIRVTSPGPALFTQSRVTKDGRVFTMYKFRSMVTDPSGAVAGEDIDLTAPFFKLEEDPRLTSIGRVLRSFSLDELPQLWNVVRGDMSLVGPRPLPVEQVEANRKLLAPRHEVRAGLTGLWQVSGRSELDPGEAVRIDRFYIDNWSLGLDLRIVGRTIVAVFTRRGAL